MSTSDSWHNFQGEDIVGSPSFHQHKATGEEFSNLLRRMEEDGMSIYSDNDSDPGETTTDYGALPRKVSHLPRPGSAPLRLEGTSVADYTSKSRRRSESPEERCLPSAPPPPAYRDDPSAAQEPLSQEAVSKRPNKSHSA